MATVDGLDIQISASVKTANEALKNLTSKLDKVTASLGRVNGNGLSQMSVGVNRLSNAMDNFSKNTKNSDFSKFSRSFALLNKIDMHSINNTVDAVNKLGNAMNGIGKLNFSDSTKQVANMAKSLSLLNKINEKSIKNATVAVGKLAGAMNGIGKLDFGDNTTKISELSKGLSSLGGKAAVSAVDNIPKLATAMKNFMTTLSTAPKVSQNLIDMTTAMSKFARTGSSGAKAANSLGISISGMGRKIAGVPAIIRSFNHNTIGMAGNLKSAASQLKSVIGTIGGFGGVFALLKNSMDISSDLTEVQNVVDVTFGEKNKKKIEDFAKISIFDFGMSPLTAKEMAGRFQAMGVAVGFSQGKMADMSVELTKLAADMASFYNVEQDAVATSLQSVFTGETEPLELAA